MTEDPHPKSHKPLLFVAAGLLALGAAVGMSYLSQRKDEAVPPPAATSPAPQQKAAVQSPVRPSFDVVRINPEGDTVMAGRATPKAEVEILDGGKSIGSVTADGRGEWVFLPSTPLPPGSRELTLRSRNADGSVTEADAPVVLMVPDKPGEPAIALRMAPGDVTLLQGPDTATSGALAVQALGYSVDGRVTLSGKADPGSAVSLYLDNKLIGRARAGEDGTWKLENRHAMSGGSHLLRADQLNDKGKVTQRVELGFSLTGQMPAEGKIVVEKGANLWRIARKVYGSGYDFALIYKANKSDIKDPNLIYPGQVFTVPGRE